MNPRQAGYKPATLTAASPAFKSASVFLRRLNSIPDLSSKLAGHEEVESPQGGVENRCTLHYANVPFILVSSHSVFTVPPNFLIIPCVSSFYTGSNLKWQGYMDLNHDKEIQSLRCCHYIIPQYC